jgi:basic amino acid/polyamine antiporter, APA family
MSQSSASLLRQLGVVSATALVVSNMVGTGIFTTTGFLAGDLGSPVLVIAIWLVGAVCALAGAFCYSELGMNFPSSGGEYVYLTEAYGPTWGFMTGWVSFLAGFSAPIALASLAFSDYLGHFYPSLRQANSALFGPEWLGLRFGAAQLTACGLIALFTLLNFFGVRRVAGIQNVLTSIKIGVILLFILLGLGIGKGSFQHFSMPAVRTSAYPVAAQFAISLLFIYVAYSGWNAATYIAEELRRPERTLPIALTLGTAIVAALFIGLNLVFLYAAPLEDMKGVVAVGALAAERLFGREIADIFSGLMAVSLMSTVNAMVTIGPRVYYAMAKNGAFFHAASSVNERWRTPVAAIVAQGVVSMLMTLTSFPQLFFYIGFMLNFFTGLSVSSLFIFRRRPGWQKLRVVSFAWPLVPAIFLLVGAWLILYGLMLKPSVSMIGVITLAAGALIYHVRIAPQLRREQARRPIM